MNERKGELPADIELEFKRAVSRAMSPVVVPPDLRFNVERSLVPGTDRGWRIGVWAALAAAIALGVGAVWWHNKKQIPAGLPAQIVDAGRVFESDVQLFAPTPPSTVRPADNADASVSAAPTTPPEPSAAWPAKPATPTSIEVAARQSFESVPGPVARLVERAETNGLMLAGASSPHLPEQAWSSVRVLFRDAESGAWGSLLVQSDDGTSGLHINGTMTLSLPGLPEQSIAAWKEGPYAVYLFVSDLSLMKRARAAAGTPRSFIGIPAYD